MTSDNTAASPPTTTPPAPQSSPLAHPEVFNLLELVNYQPGAIVSREVVHRGTVRVFAFDRDEGLSEHTAPFDALVQVIEGEALISIVGRPFHVQAGEIILLPANQPHAVRATTRFKMLLTHLPS